MEIYLSHMMIFRIVEKIGLQRAVGNGWIQYMFTVLIVIVGATVFAVIVRKAIGMAEKILLERTTKKEWPR